MKRSQASSVLLCFEDHRPDGLVWAVMTQNTWHYAKAVEIAVPMTTVYHGKFAEQPKAYLLGVGVVRGTEDMLTITKE